MIEHSVKEGMPFKRERMRKKKKERKKERKKEGI